MSQKVFLSLHKKAGGDPLGDHHLSGLLSLDLILQQNIDAGHLILNLYTGEDYVGMVNLVWDGTLEYADPKAGHYLLGSAFLDEVVLDIDDEDDAKARAIIIDCMKRSGMSYHDEIRQPDDIRAFIVAIKRHN